MVLRSLVAALAVAIIASLGAPSAPSAGTAAVGLQVVRDVGGYESLLVFHDVTYAVAAANRAALYRSTDEGVTWQPLHTFGSRLWTLVGAEPGILLGAENGGSAGGQIIWRSDDGGRTWTQGQFEDPASPGHYLGSLSMYGGALYQLLSAANIAQSPVTGDLLLGTYIAGPASTNPTIIYRSRDGGRTWQIVSSDRAAPQHRHIHALQFDPATGALYIFYGDTPSRDGVWRSTDEGATASPVCIDASSARCIAVDAALDGTDAVWGSDNPFATNQIVDMSLATLSRRILRDGIAYPAYSTLRTACGTTLLATMYEGLGVWQNGDHDRRVYAVDANDNVTDVLDYPIAVGSDGVSPVPYPQGLYLVGQAADGTIAVQVMAHGTIFVRPTGESCGAPPVQSAPVDQSPPTISGSAVQGSTLTATPGTWAGTPAPTLTYQWLRCAAGTCTPIAGATQTSYALGSADVGATVVVRVTATNTAGSASADSQPTAVVTPPVDAANLMPDPDFEASPQQYYAYGTGAYTWAADAAHSGSRSLKIVRSDSSDYGRWMTVTGVIRVQPGKTLTARAFLRTVAVSQGATLTLTFWNASQQYVGLTVDSPRLTGTQDWSPAAVAAVVPATAATVRVEFRLWGAGTLWIDDASLTQQ